MISFTNMSPLEGLPAIEFDDVLNKFTFGLSQNIALAGDSFIDYTVTVTGMIYGP